MAKTKLAPQPDRVLAGGRGRQHRIDLPGGDLTQQRLERGPHLPPQQRPHPIHATSIHATSIHATSISVVPGRLDPAHQLLVVNPSELAAQQQSLGAQRQHRPGAKPELRQ
jgi:hypothetical protein